MKKTFVLLLSFDYEGGTNLFIDLYVIIRFIVIKTMFYTDCILLSKKF